MCLALLDAQMLLLIVMRQIQVRMKNCQHLELFCQSVQQSGSLTCKPGNPIGPAEPVGPGKPFGPYKKNIREIQDV